jgi:hypothetical protein
MNKRDRSKRAPAESLKHTYTVSTIIDYEPIDGSHLLLSDPAAKIKTIQVKFKYSVKGLSGSFSDLITFVKKVRDDIVEHQNNFFEISSDLHIQVPKGHADDIIDDYTYEVFTITFTLPTQDLLKQCFTLASDEDSLISKLKQIIVYPNLDEKRHTGPRIGRITPQDTKKRIDGEVIQLLEEFTRRLSHEDAKF